ncbi:MAG TPA: hypothetical protein VMQ86_04445 [Bryobacteraceae bacterium]|jgi:hypothetical protein|nr:hypothetical protein [Bryobacteraceae bacterium]
MRTIGWLLSFALWGTVTQTVNFDSAKPGSVPPGWTVTPHAGKAPQWEIRTDPSAPSPPYVFAEISRHAAADAAGDPCPLAILNKTTVKDGDLSVKVKPVAGKEDRAGGLVFRYRDPDNYYLVRANALENSILLYKVEDGKRIPLASRGAPPNSFGVKHPVPLNQWSMLKVQFRGPLFSVYFNHRRLFEVLDTTFGQPGKVGLWTRADGVTYFDDFRIAGK